MFSGNGAAVNADGALCVVCSVGLASKAAMLPCEAIFPAGVFGLVPFSGSVTLLLFPSSFSSSSFSCPLCGLPPFLSLPSCPTNAQKSIRQSHVIYVFSLSSFRYISLLVVAIAPASQASLHRSCRC